MTGTYSVLAKESGERIDALLALEIEDLTRSQAVRLIESGAVTLNGVPVKKNRRTTAGEVYIALIPDSEEAPITPEDIPLDVVWEDQDLIVINKPRGMVVHPAPGHPSGTLVNALMHHCEDSLSGIGGEKRPGIVHRIDKDTTGLIIAAKNDFSHLALSAQLADRSLSRVYEAVVLGRMRQDSGVIDAPIGRHPANRKLMAVTDKNSRHAVTHWEVVNRYRNYTHVRCKLETGRTHQIRVHMSHIGHPIAGDPVYGKKSSVGGLEGQCLHARKLSFIHPRTGTPITVESELPEYFLTFLSKLGPVE